jgi:hypothetical protein
MVINDISHLPPISALVQYLCGDVFELFGERTYEGRPGKMVGRSGFKIECDEGG